MLPPPLFILAAAALSCAAAGSWRLCRCRPDWLTSPAQPCNPSLVAAKEVWEGVQNRYWHLPVYFVPTCVMQEQQVADGGAAAADEAAVAGEAAAGDSQQLEQQEQQPAASS